MQMLKSRVRVTILIFIGTSIALVGAFLLTDELEVRHKGKRNAALQKLAAIEVALNLYKKDVGRCPIPGGGWKVVFQKYGLDETLGIDPWGRGYAYLYLEDGLKCSAYSFGENGIDDGMKGDDIFLESK